MTQSAACWTVSTAILVNSDALEAVRLGETIMQAFEQLPEAEIISCVQQTFPRSMNAAAPETLLRSEFFTFEEQDEAEAFDSKVLAMIRALPEISDLEVYSSIYLERHPSGGPETGRL